MATYGSGNQGQNNDYDLGYWIITIILLISPLWFVGLIMLLLKLTGRRDRARQARQARQARHPYDIEREQRQSGGRPTPGTQGTPYANRTTPPAGRQTWQQAGAVRRTIPNRGRGLTIGGAVLAIIFGIGLISSFPFVAMDEGPILALAMLSPVIGFFIGGLAMIWVGTQRAKKSRRFNKYLALIGRREAVPVMTLAQAMPASVHQACEDLQEMLDKGYLPTGYLDMGTGRLVLSDAGIQDAPEPDPAPETERPGPSTEDEILNEIRRVNDEIADKEMSRKIDRIGEITGKIFAYQKQNPGKDTQLRSFLSYYLPTTLKILRAYAQMEAQGIEGENIRAAKTRIESMMDKVVEGFEKQLDRLFQNDAMDITTDVEVLEQMLQNDGLSGGGGMTLGGV